MSIHDLIGSLILRPDATIIEVGANEGQDTCQLARLIPQGHVFAFEPDPRAIALFKQLRGDGNVTLFETAVGAQTGKTIFHQSGDATHDWNQSGSIRKPKLHLEVYPWVTFGKTIEVPITTLDDWAAGRNIACVDFMWADVQGAEIDLIKGAQDTLSKTRYFYTEFSDQELYEGEANLAEIRAALPDFEVVEIFPRDVLFKNRRLDPAG